MRLLLLASAMKSFDVVVLMLPTDEENLRLHALLTEMRPMLQYVTKRQNELDGRPQLIMPLQSEANHAEVAQIAQARPDVTGVTACN